ncbi:MAG: substrate-binding domain-containing protein [Opitutales bacterium]|nr:substrate-binding domain-containing protein [Opitutales bacterium]
MNVRIALGSFFPSYVCQEIARGVLEEAERLRGENPQLSLEVWESKTYDRFLREHRLVKFDGALAFGNYWHVVFGGKGWPPLSTLGIPWINTSNRFYHPDVPKVVQDDIAIGRLAGRFLARKQPQAFAFLGFPDEFFFSEERRLGFIQRAGIAPEQLLDAPRVRGESLHHPGSAQDALMQDWIASLPRNTAIFAANDEKGANLLSRLSAFPRRVPADLTLIGADDDPAFTKRTNLALSSIHIGGAAVGRRALRTLT